MIQAKALIDKFEYALQNEWGYIYGTAGELWTAEKQAAATREQTVKYGKRWIGHNVVDCSGIFSWAFKQLGGYCYHGSNTMYKSYCTSKGKLTSSTALKPGYAVFTGTEDAHDHVGLFIGDGWVIEARGTQYGVVKTKLSDKKWTYWGELKGVDYAGTSSGGSPGTARPTLRKGDKGEAVAEMQGLLAGRGYDLGKYGIDGDFGSATEKAVKAFQKDVGLTADGVVGAKTWAALEGPQEPKKEYSVKVTGLTKEEAEGITDMLRAQGRTVTMLKGGA